ncbi:23S rRNA (guanosine(2251)-2'-O)-methyltransferase RlmB [Ferruginivarius sediminum]|uniref:23S rRNA (Guanosine(2251)-2'-O)-methyltransferase RlmB n=1 Tax=Ferruginivarius sediminum TaxID=2661937 RepID=A0A369T8L4_9PROT|nr:23S rRNA (guanosine(2251)-2'-O)-methyltransferase RlmB [Ferruginivarius sediminum]RDD61618.1 23S rRNA (guanosine(2251)-2'-O)-methyltransferase RlmB [Ferruginivarius sediminum]
MARRNTVTRGKSGKSPTRTPAAHRGRGPKASGADSAWLWGGHAVLAALANRARRCRRLLLAAESAETWQSRAAPLLNARQDLPQGAEIVSRQELAGVLPPHAVHQGIALLAEPLRQPTLGDVIDALPTGQPAAMVILDQVSDPQNVGAVLRSAAAFGAAAVIATKHNAPTETGALAKAASGALEHVPFPHVPNLARAIEELQAAGFRVLGLAGEATALLADESGETRTAIVLGAEGRGLRRLTRERCDALVRLPTDGAIADLNVSNAAAVALYELLGRGRFA